MQKTLSILKTASAIFILVAILLPGGTLTSAAIVGPTGDVGGGVPEVDEFVEGMELGLTDGDPNAAYTTGLQVNNTAAAMVAEILGHKPVRVPELTPVDPADIIYNDGSGTKVVYSKGAVGHLAEYTAAFYAHPPARTDVYIADVLNSTGIATPAYAQGLGFASLSPILSAWKAMRNLAYFFFVLVFLTIGFLIMMRHRVGGQTVITAQLAIPRVIIALLAVTFSYAIAGLLIDAMYVFMFLMIGIFSSSANLIDMTFLDLAATLVVGGATSIYEIVYSFVQQITGNLPGVAQDALSTLGGLSVAVVVALAILFGVFKLFFILLRTYVSIIVSIVLSPLFLMVGAIPGQNVFGKWVKSIVGNLAAFPATLLILLIYEQLTGALSGNIRDISATGGFMPPYLIGGGTGDVIVFIIGFGMILIIGDLVQQAKTAMGAGKGPFDIFAQNLADALKKGWEGGQVIPGLGFTDTRKYGLTGQNLASQVGKKSAVTVGGAVGGFSAGLADIRNFPSAFHRGASQGGGYTASKVDEKQLYQKGRERYEASQKNKQGGGGHGGQGKQGGGHP